MGAALIRRLEGPELAMYDHIDPAVLRRVRVVIVRWLPDGAAGLTLGTFVFLRRDRADDRGLLAHELVHVQQYADVGWRRFLITYLRDYLGHRWQGKHHHDAYLAIDAETEARHEAKKWKARRTKATGSK